MRKENVHGFMGDAETGGRRPNPRALTNVCVGYLEGKCGAWASPKRLRDLWNIPILHSIFRSELNKSHEVGTLFFLLLLVFSMTGKKGKKHDRTLNVYNTNLTQKWHS